MTDLLGDALGWLQRQQRTHCAVTVTYARGNDSVSAPATVGRSDNFSSDEEAGAKYVNDRRDFIIDAADLVLAEAETTPERNDTITHDGLTWTVLPRDESGICFRYADPQRTAFRIFTKLEG